MSVGYIKKSEKEEAEKVLRSYKQHFLPFLSITWISFTLLGTLEVTQITLPTQIQYFKK